MDLNGDGRLQENEIKAGWKKYIGRDLGQDELDDILKNVDADGNGYIDYSEFVVSTLNEQGILSSNKLKTAFKMFDKDGGGSITIDEIKKVLAFGQKIDKGVLKQIMK